MARVKWKNQQTGEKAQFIAETLNEALFNYSFDSNKAPTLNTHFFCEDYLATYAMVNEAIMQEGNMVPLNEEFEHIVTNSIWMPACVSPSVLNFRNKQGFFFNIKDDKNCKNIETAKRSEYYKDSANYICQLLSSDQDYSSLILKEINNILLSSTFTLEEKTVLYFCVREYVSELINLGYSKTHLYMQVQNKLFKYRTSKDDVKYIIKFLSSLQSSEEKYSVILGISDKAYSEFEGLINCVREAAENEKASLSANYVVDTDKIRASDPVSALESAKKMMSTFIDIYNAGIHDCNMRIFDNGLVKAEEGENYVLINDSINLLTKNPIKAKEERQKWIKVAVQRNITPSVVAAFDLHNNALQICEPSTQLLSLWTIIEVIIETKQNFMSRSNYITNILCDILCSTYFHRCISALHAQITHFPGIKAIIDSEPRGNDTVEKLALILKDNTALQASLIAKLKKYPLEAYKIEHFSNLFGSKERMASNIIRHSNRLRWQIMRIYRNRCMIVHNGSNFPYINSILENLHFYIDELFDYILLKTDVGLKDLEAIFACARIKQSEAVSILSDKKTTLSDDEYIDMIFKY